MSGPQINKIIVENQTSGNVWFCDKSEI